MKKHIALKTDEQTFGGIGTLEGTFPDCLVDEEQHRE